MEKMTIHQAAIDFIKETVAQKGTVQRKDVVKKLYVFVGEKTYSTIYTTADRALSDLIKSGYLMRVGVGIYKLKN